jgi:hypothetical protein
MEEEKNSEATRNNFDLRTLDLSTGARNRLTLAAKKKQVRKMIVSCSALLIKDSDRNKVMDKEIRTFQGYLGQLKGYINFKTKNPYAQNDPDYEATDVPISLFDQESSTMNINFHHKQSRAQKFK